MALYFVLILALSMDTFMAALSYEGSKIKIPFSSNLIISFICSFSLIISLFLGNIISFSFKWISFLILFIIGVFKIFDGYIKKFIKGYDKKINFSFRGLSFVINIYGDYKKADLDSSKHLSWFEAIYLGLALSIDSLCSGLAFDVDYDYFILIFVFSVFVNVLAIFSSKVIRRFDFDFSLIGGIIFIILAFLRL